MADQERQERLGIFRAIEESMPVFAKELVAGGVAGGIAKSAVAPLERVKILFQARTFSSSSVFSSSDIVDYFILWYTCIFKDRERYPIPSNFKYFW